MRSLAYVSRPIAMPDEVAVADLDDAQIVDGLKRAFASGKTRNLEWRKDVRSSYRYRRDLAEAPRSKSS
jgi:hypothetical protein